MENLDESIADLYNIASKEEASLSKYLLSVKTDKTALLLEIVRFMDVHLISTFGAKRDRPEWTALYLPIYGFSTALSLLLPQTINNQGVANSQSSPDKVGWAGSLLAQLGALRLLERLTDLVQSRMLSVSVGHGVVTFKRVSDEVGVEMYEMLEDGLNAEKVREFYGEDEMKGKIDSATLKKMSGLVSEAENGFITYGASPEIDHYFLNRAIQFFTGFRSFSGIHPKSEFDGVTGKELSVVAVALASLHQKHVVFCSEYLKKFGKKDWASVLTIWDEKEGLKQALVHFTGLKPVVIDRCLKLFSMNVENVGNYGKSMTPIYPALIEITKNLWLRPASAGYLNSLSFAAGELKRTNRKIWDREMQSREAWFRDDLYHLFMGTRYIKVGLSKQLQHDKKTITDIDAAIFDVETSVLALFELKWQEPFGEDEAGRRSRAHNLRNGIDKWTKAVKFFIEKNGTVNLGKQLGFTEDVSKSIGQVFLFVIARFNARFSGFEMGRNISVTSWSQFQRLRLEVGPIESVFQTIIDKANEELSRPTPGTPRTINFKVGNLEIVAEGYVSAFP